jgi:hypothetical protein
MVNDINLEKKIETWLSTQRNINQNLWEELVYLRNRPVKKRKNAQRINFDRPVSVFSKPDRLKTGLGREITLIMRSKACSWAHSKSGGCSMCGYFNDRASTEIKPENYWHQFEKAISQYHEALNSDENNYIFKIFTSGSFTDPDEIPLEIQERILTLLVSYASIKEIVVESRPEYLSEAILTRYAKILNNTYLEFGVGLESADDFIRTNLINKGFPRVLFEKKVSLLHKFGFGVKAYILLKPPFLNEYSAIMDTFATIRYCVAHNIDTISINPTNIQMNTICEELEKTKQFRSPWIYSLLWVIKNALTQPELNHMRVICDPSAKGKERGVHNCDPKNPSNQKCLTILEKFIETQDLTQIPESFSNQCYEDFIWALFYGDM